MARDIVSQRSNRSAAPTVVIADDHPGVRREIVDLVTPDFDVLETVGDGESLVKAVRALRPDVVISDIQMPRMSGIEAGTRIIREGLCHSIVLLTMYGDSQLVTSAL